MFDSMFPDDHPLAGYDGPLETHADHLRAYSHVLEQANPEEAQAVMVVITGEQGTDTLPSISTDVDSRWASLWMLGTHIHHVTQSGRAAGDGTLTMEEAAHHAIQCIREHTGSRETYQ